MDGKEFTTMVLIVFLSLWGSLYLEADLASYFVLELFVIFLLIIVSVGIFYSIASGKSWAWKALAAFFFVSTVNSIVVYSATRNTTPFALILFVNVAGLVIVFARQPNMTLRQNEPLPDISQTRLYHIDESDLVDHIETYETQPEDFLPATQIANKAAKKKKLKPKARKKKAGKKTKKEVITFS